MARKSVLIGILALSLIVNDGVDSISLNFGDVTEMLNFARETTSGILEAMEWTKPGTADDKQYDFPFVKRMERRLLNHISVVSKKIDDIESNVDRNSGEIIATIIRDLPVRNRLDRNLDDLSWNIGQIESMFKDYRDYHRNWNDTHRGINDGGRFETFTLKNFAETSVSNGAGGIPNLLRNIHRLVVPSNFSKLNNGILMLLAENMKKGASQICDEQQSPSQLLYNLYKTIVLTEMKGSSMMQFSYTLLKLYNNATFTEEIRKAEKDYDRRISNMLKAVTTAMSYAPRELWKCDPSVHKEGSTYEELKQLIQGYIVNEVDLNSKSTCKETCGYYSLATVNGCYENGFCSKQRQCMGKVLKCQYIDSDMWICPSARKSTRRYEYIEYENGRIFGNKKTCSAGTTKVDSWWRWLFWHCSYCMCYCDDNNSSSHRYFSLREALADVEKNRVITGMRLIKMNQIMHLQIQQGELKQRAEIDESSVEWKEVDNFSVMDRNVTNGRDYHTLAWERRAIDLDDLIAPDSHVLTGVRYRLVGAHLNFEIRITPFNYTDGTLIKPLEKSTWLSNDMTDVKNPANPEPARTEFQLNKPDIPTRSRNPSQPDSKSNQYLNFGPTDLEKDAAQSTVPFLDIQPVVTNPPFPLSGAGVYHKGHDGSGGFVGLRIITYDFTKHLRTNTAPTEEPLLTSTEGIPVNEIPIVNEIPSF